LRVPKFGTINKDIPASPTINASINTFSTASAVKSTTHFPAQPHFPQPLSPGRLCVRAYAPVLNQAVQSTFERTSIAFERTCRGCYIFEWLRLIIVPALERISAAAAADQRQVCVLFLLFLILFNYLFVYLFILPVFIYLLFLVFVS
jgi:hypothetical protein